MLKKFNKFIEDVYEFMGEARLVLLSKKPNSKELMRSILGSVSSMPELVMSEGERKAMIGRVESSYQDLKRIINNLYISQRDFMAKESDDLLFPRGTINGISLIEEELDSMHNEFMADANGNRPEEEGLAKTLPQLLSEQSRTGIPKGRV